MSSRLRLVQPEQLRESELRSLEQGRKKKERGRRAMGLYAIIKQMRREKAAKNDKP